MKDTYLPDYEYVKTLNDILTEKLNDSPTVDVLNENVEFKESRTKAVEVFKNATFHHYLKDEREFYEKES